MENTQQLLEKMEAVNRKQLLFTKIMCILCALAVICSLVVMITVSKTASALAELSAPMQELAAQAEGVMTDLSTAANELSKVDFSSIVAQVDSLAAESQTAIVEASKKLDAIDIDTLNKAIKDLADIVEPLAKISRLQLF